MFIDRLTIRMRLVIAVAIPCIALLGVGILGMWSISAMQVQSDHLYRNSVMPLRSMAEVSSRIPRMRVGIDMMFLQQTGLRDARGVISRIQDARNEDIPQMQQALETAIQSQVKPELIEQTKAFQSHFNQMVSQELEPMFVALEAGDFVTAQSYYARYASSYGSARKEAESLLDSIVQEAKAQYQVAESFAQTAHREEPIVVGLGLLISMGCAGWIVYQMRLRVDMLRRGIDDATKNLCLTQHIELSGQDELSAIAKSYNQFVGNIHQALTEVSQSAQTLAKVSQGIYSRAEDTEQNSMQQRDRVEQVATAMHELGATVGEIANNAAHAAESAKLANVDADQGQQIMGQARSHVKVLDQELNQAAQVVSTLATQIYAIRDILDIIRGISEQTNLLALNAAIEAARAGEQGRGFAVVADEVRTLASRSAESTEEIQRVIDSLEGESQRAVQAMEKGQAQNIQVVEFATRVTEVLDRIHQHVASINDQNIQVATATEEQSSVVNDINQNVEDIHQRIATTAEMTKALNLSSDELLQLSNQLGTLVARFEL
ncbi:hypothetical protein VST7929_01954 [Vibrio stylophorae]|uniref:Methyl-accepting chemotaxis protein n=1 Tax=Vibrio stylophorae TaxID=659351 RepID=A0ABM8ZVL9_9VIBR|nr:methyl-accepting chemotaxis protein [Vibrio stylophorae]CAH0534053.1 hypothetical protein VST7929_01954 [Vibrio stylophorae]